MGGLSGGSMERDMNLPQPQTAGWGYFCILCVDAALMPTHAADFIRRLAGRDTTHLDEGLHHVQQDSGSHGWQQSV